MKQIIQEMSIIAVVIAMLMVILLGNFGCAGTGKDSLPFQQQFIDDSGRVWVGGCVTTESK